MKHRALFLVVPLVFAAATALADGDPAPPAQPPVATAPSDAIVLKDGRRLEGEIVGEDDRAISLKSGGVTRTYAKDSIASVERAPRKASPPDSDGKQGATPPAEPTKGKKGKGEKREAPLSDAAKKWLDDLVAKSADVGDETVRRSLTQAIQALGPAAIPAVRAAAQSAPDGPQKQFLDRVATDMEQRRDRAGEGRPGQARRGLDDLMQRLATELELKDEQKPKLAAVLGDAMKKRFEIFGAARREGLTQDQVTEKITALRTDLLAQAKTILTEPQYATFEEMSQRFFEATQGAGPPKPPMKPGDGDQPMPPEKPPEPAK